MKIKDVIKKLKQFEPDLEVCVDVIDYSTFRNERLPIKNIEEKKGTFQSDRMFEEYGKYISIS